MNKCDSTMTMGIYVHIPFCLRKCLYCDFCSLQASDSVQNTYVDMLCREIRQTDECRLPVDTVFIGGGTPSLLASSSVEKILSELHKKFSFSDKVEMTIEANPATVTFEKAQAYRSFGINRVSIGVQSFSDDELTSLGRMHTAAEAVDCIEIFRRADFSKINLDVMYGIPGQSVSSFEKTLRRVFEIEPEHLSAYSLILEQGTEFYKRRQHLDLPGEDMERAMYDLLCFETAKKGYRHYEISNYAKGGCECLHNLRYWRRLDYLGFGLAARSCMNFTRLSHTEKIEDYLSGNILPYVEEQLIEENARFEQIMLGLRTDDGVCEEYLFQVIGKDKFAFIDRCLESGYLRRRAGNIAPTDDGMYVLNGILSEILPDSFFHK